MVTGPGMWKDTTTTGYQRPPSGQYRATVVLTGDDLGDQHMQWLIIQLLSRMGHIVYVEDIAKLPDTGAAPRHVPRRGSDVEAWIKRHRDEWAERMDPAADHDRRERWEALDALLDDYRERADTGEDLTTREDDDA